MAGDAIDGDANISAVAAVLAHPDRARFMDLLIAHGTMSISELGRETGFPPPTASRHVAALRAAHLVLVSPNGRERLVHVASAQVAEAVEALARISPLQPVRSLRQAQTAEAFRWARTCYDHLAGAVGVAVFAALVDKAVVAPGGTENRRLVLTGAGREWLRARGIDLGAVVSGGRPTALACSDWSERRPHLAGALGAAILGRFRTEGWVVTPGNRRVTLTPEGMHELETLWQVAVPPMGRSG